MISVNTYGININLSRARAVGSAYAGCGVLSAVCNILSSFLLAVLNILSSLPLFAALWPIARGVLSVCNSVTFW